MTTMNRKTFMTLGEGATATELIQAQRRGDAKPAQRLAHTYYFDDADMDLFFVAALGWGPAGGLDIGQAFYSGHRDILSTRKSFVMLEASTGADGHVQVNNRLRLAEESSGWLGETFAV
jgi:hypothetical protein